MQIVKRVLQRAAWTLLAVMLVACGNGGKGIPPEEKRVVIGTAAHIKAKRDSTHHLSKPLPFGVTHQRFKDGKQLADDAPHPYTKSSGTVLLSARSKGLARVAFHEDNSGTISNAAHASYLVSDASIVSAAAADPQHPNAVLLTLTGKKGNAYITGLNERGDAISKFMVLAAEPDSDVLVVSDSDIHPRLCSSRGQSKFGTVCDYNSSTNFDLGDSGPSFSMDDYIKDGVRGEKYILFDALSIEKLKKLNTNGSSNFRKKAIYFESIDTLFVMESDQNVQRMALIGRNPSDPADTDPQNDSLYFSALQIRYLATQEEFNTYIDFGGKLTSSPLRDFGVQDILTHEITPDNPVDAVLVGAKFADGSRISATQENIRYVVGASRSSIDSYIYQMRHRVQGADLKTGGLECHVYVTNGNLVKFGITSLKSVAKVALNGLFNWNNGRPDIGLDLSPHASTGGQLELFLDGSVKVVCDIPLVEIKMAEWGIPLFATVQFSVPISFEVWNSVNGFANMVLALPSYNMGAPNDPTAAGKVGVSYSSNGGFKSDFEMQSTIAKDHLGIAEGTKLHDSTKGEIGMGLGAGVAVGLDLKAYVNTWVLRTTVDASIGDAVIGFKADGAYVIDTTSKKSRVTPKGDAGFGAFLSFSPTIELKTKFFTWSFNLYNYEVRPRWWYKLPVKEGVDETFEPAETTNTLKFTKCYPKAPSACVYQTNEDASPNTVNYVNSNQKFTMTEPPLLPFYIDGPGFLTYAYVIRDKISGDLVVNEVPMVFPEGVFPGKQGYAYKYGVTDVLAEAVYSKKNSFPSPDRTYCAFTAWGDKLYTSLFNCQN